MAHTDAAQPLAATCFGPTHRGSVRSGPCVRRPAAPCTLRSGRPQPLPPQPGRDRGAYLATAWPPAVARSGQIDPSRKRGVPNLHRSRHPSTELRFAQPKSVKWTLRCPTRPRVLPRIVNSALIRRGFGLPEDGALFGHIRVRLEFRHGRRQTRNGSRRFHCPNLRPPPLRGGALPMTPGFQARASSMSAAACSVTWECPRCRHGCRAKAVGTARCRPLRSRASVRARLRDA